MLNRPLVETLNEWRESAARALQVFVPRASPSRKEAGEDAEEEKLDDEDNALQQAWATCSHVLNECHRMNAARYLKLAEGDVSLALKLALDHGTETFDDGVTHPAPEHTPLFADGKEIRKDGLDDLSGQHHHPPNHSDPHALSPLSPPFSQPPPRLESSLALLDMGESKRGRKGERERARDKRPRKFSRGQAEREGEGEGEWERQGPREGGRAKARGPSGDARREMGARGWRGEEAHEETSEGERQHSPERMERIEGHTEEVGRLARPEPRRAGGRRGDREPGRGAGVPGGDGNVAPLKIHAGVTKQEPPFVAHHYAGFAAADRDKSGSITFEEFAQLDCNKVVCLPYTLRPAPHTLRPTPHTLHPS